MICRNVFYKFYIVLLISFIFSSVITISVYAKADEWEFIINTSDGTPEKGSKENTVGYDDFGFFTKPAILGNRTDKALKKLKDHETYWKEVDPDHSTDLTQNGSLHIDTGLDLYVYDGVAYNGTTGAAYSNGYYFTISWKKKKMDLSDISGLDPLSYVDTFSFDESSQMRGTTANIYKLMITFSGAGMVFSFIVAGIKVSYRGIKVLKDDLIDVLGYKIIVFVAICAFAGIFGLFGELFETIQKL
jgi:hypothetical protein